MSKCHFAMSKRAGESLQGETKKPKTAAARLKANGDCMDLVIMAVKYSNDNLAKEVGELKEANAYMHRQVQRLDKYTEELEARLETMETLVSRMLADGAHHVVEAHAHCIREEGGHDMTDLDRLIMDYETEEEGLDWFDEFVNNL